MTTYHTLNSLLAELYPTQSTSRRVVNSIGMDPRHIEFKDEALTNWDSILSEVRRRFKVNELIEFACSEYQERASELRALQSPTTVSRLEPSIQLTQSSYVNALSQGAQTTTLSSLDRWKSTATFVPQGLGQTPPKKFTEPDPELLRIGRDWHWDRDEATRDFFLMLTQEKTGDKKKDKQQVLLLQGKEAGLESLIDRFSEMCDRITTTRPVLHTRVTLTPLYNDHYNLAFDIVDRLLRFAQRNNLIEQEKILNDTYNYVVQVLESPAKPSGIQFAKLLTETYLAKVCADSTLVLLLEGFDRLCNKDTSEWLMKTWLNGQVWHVEGLVVLLTAEAGLDDLKGQEFVSHHDLPPLNKETLKEWATRSQLYGFDWFTDEDAKNAHEICDGNPEKFRKLLNYTSRLLKVGKD